MTFPIKVPLPNSSLNTATNIIPLDFTQLEQTASESLAAMGFVPEYVAIRETGTLLPPKNNSNSKVVLVAAKLGEVRLIDNIRV